MMKDITSDQRGRHLVFKIENEFIVYEMLAFTFFKMKFIKVRMRNNYPEKRVSWLNVMLMRINTGSRGR